MYSVGSLPRSDADGETACNRSGVATHSIFKTESDESMHDCIGSILRPQSLSSSPLDFLSEPCSPVDTTLLTNKKSSKMNSNSKRLLQLKTAISSADLNKDSSPIQQQQEIQRIPSGVIITCTCTTPGQGLQHQQGWKTASTLSLALSTSSCSTPRVRSRSQSIVRGESTVWKLDGGDYSSGSSPRMYATSHNNSSRNSAHQNSHKYTTNTNFDRHQDGSYRYRGSVTSPTAASTVLNESTDDAHPSFNRSAKSRSNSFPLILSSGGSTSAEIPTNNESMICYKDLWNYF